MLSTRRGKLNRFRVELVPRYPPIASSKVIKSDYQVSSDLSTLIAR